MSDNLKKVSKFLSLVLRHKPQAIGITLDKEGWVDTDILLEALKQNGKAISFDQLKDVVENNDKKRFILENNRIRANQGHSINIDLGLKPTSPPEFLFHGTATRFLDSILKEGLKKRNRQHVHLSSNIETAMKVGARHGKPVILKIHSEKMNNQGINFFLSKNNVWLTNDVPVEYIKIENKNI